MDEKTYEMFEDVMGSPSVMSHCCSAAIYAPTDEWARCMGCLEYCDVVEEE